MNKSTIITLILGILIGMGIVMWSADKDAKVISAMTTFENCVEQEYGQTVQQLLAQGVKPECL